MAKVGEGDPRWIVEVRPDATNVNNWHWAESDGTAWSKDLLKNLFVNFEITDGKLHSQVMEFEKIEGEAVANNRKGKLLFFYEWLLVLKWRGTVLGGDPKEKVDGKITIPNLSEENSIDEIDIQVTVEANDFSEKTELLKSFMYNFGRPKIREQINKYIESLKKDYAKNLILPKKTDVVPDQPKTMKPAASTQKVLINEFSSTKISTEQKPILGVKMDVKTITFNEKFQCSAQQLYDALTKIEMVTAFTRGHVKMDACKGGAFVLFGGNISGNFTELVPNKKIVQSWRYKQWPTGHFSNVTMEFEEMPDHTILNLKQTLVPTNEYETTLQNWPRYYFESMRSAFGFGSYLF